jgi:hypothetical protein
MKVDLKHCLKIKHLPKGVNMNIRQLAEKSTDTSENKLPAQKGLNIKQ